MSNYLVIFKTVNGVVFTIQLEASSFSDAEKQALIYPLMKEIIQITIFN